jgi:hypothetical protein
VHRSMTDAEEGRFVAGTIFEQNAKPNEWWLCHFISYQCTISFDGRCA